MKEKQKLSWHYDKYYTRIHNQVLRCGDFISGNEFRLLCAIISFRKPSEEWIWVHQKRLAHHIGVSHIYVRKMLKSLAEDSRGILSVKVMSDSKSGSEANHYRVNLSAFDKFETNPNPYKKAS